jgi:hypothetical protein
LAAWGVSKAPVVIGSLVFSEGMMTADGQFFAWRK